MQAIHRELEVWLRLSKHPTIVPLLGIAYVESPLPALISQWMPSGTLHMYLEQVSLVDPYPVVIFVLDVCSVHSENVVHGDLHPANVLIDSSGNPRLIDFGLATIAGDVELQWNTTTAARDFNPRWRAPEVLGIHSDNGDPVRPNFESDMHSFGSVAFFVRFLCFYAALIISEVIPWKEKKNTPQIIAELGKRATPARPDNILDDHWNLIQKCWSWDPEGRPKAAEVITYIPTKLTTIFGKTEMVERCVVFRAFVLYFSDLKRCIALSGPPLLKWLKGL
ncbi:kinase-like domain-containing protein [Suillus lakei]|nr:kinase-like domain-containing protein [Suillus lakei]